MIILSVMGADGIYERDEEIEGPTIPDIYPSPDAPATFSERDAPRRAGQHAVAEDAEPNAGNCCQCGMPTHDVTVESTCTFCDSDNPTGRKYSTSKYGRR